MTNRKRPSATGKTDPDPQSEALEFAGPDPARFDARLAPPAQGPDRSDRMMRIFIGAAAALAVILALMAGYGVWRGDMPGLGPSQEEKAETGRAGTGGGDGEPINLLTEREPGGVTVLVKQPELSNETPQQEAPVAAGSQIGEGWSVELGSALSFGDLSKRFAEVAQLNQEIPFDRLEPRATLKETASGLEARLLVGPFASEEDARNACGSIALPAGVECRVAPFEGELISRE